MAHIISPPTATHPKNVTMWVLIDPSKHTSLKFSYTAEQFAIIPAYLKKFYKCY